MHTQQSRLYDTDGGKCRYSGKYTYASMVYMTIFVDSVACQAITPPYATNEECTLLMTALAHLSMRGRQIAPLNCMLTTRTRTPTPRWESTILRSSWQMLLPLNKAAPPTVMAGLQAAARSFSSRPTWTVNENGDKVDNEV